MNPYDVAPFYCEEDGVFIRLKDGLVQIAPANHDGTLPDESEFTDTSESRFEGASVFYWHQIAKRKHDLSGLTNAKGVAIQDHYRVIRIGVRPDGPYHHVRLLKGQPTRPEYAEHTVGVHSDGGTASLHSGNLNVPPTYRKASQATCPVCGLPPHYTTMSLPPVAGDSYTVRMTPKDQHYADTTVVKAYCKQAHFFKYQVEG